MALEFILKQGADGAILSATLTDSIGNLDLTGWTSVHAVAAKGSAEPVLDEECTIDADPTTGRMTYEFTPTTSDIPPGEYDLEFHAIDGAGELHVFPTNKRYPYGKLIVQATKQRA